MMADHSLVLGSLALDERTPVAEGYSFAVLAGGMSFGVAQGVREVITSLLADGDLTRTTRYGNREVTFTVEIEGPDLQTLALGEAVLRAEVGRTNTLTWTAPDVLGVSTVFDVIDSSMSQTFDDLDELRRKRTFDVTLTCAPFARSADPVTVPALTPPGSVVSAVVNNADATTGWTASIEVQDGLSRVSSSVTVSDQGNFVRATGTGVLPYLSLSLTTAAIDMTPTPYLTVETSGKAGQSFFATLNGSQVSVSPVLVRATSSETTLYVFDMTGATFTNLVVVAQLYGRTSQSVTINVHDVSRTNTLDQVSPRQITRVIEVGGTERTPASIHVEPSDGSTALGKAVVHTCPEDGSGYSPSLRRWRVSGQTVSTDGGLFSGSFESITGGGITFDTPTSALPEGGYILAANMRRSATGPVDIAWSTSTVFPGGTTEEGFTNGFENVTFPDTNNWHIFPLATLSLPSVRTKAGKVRTIIQAPVTGGAITYIDEAWLFRVGDDCALSIVASSYPHLWLNSAGVDAPVPTVWVGDEASIRVHPGTGLAAMGTHILTPGGTAVFTAALVDNPETEATFYRRWHSNAAS